MTSCPPEQRVLSIQAATASSQGQRSSSVSGIPLCILSTLEAGWNQSASSNSQRRCNARSAPTVDFPHPETPMTTTTLGAGGDVSSVDGICTDINPLLPARRRDPQTNGEAQLGGTRALAESYV